MHDIEVINNYVVFCVIILVKMILKRNDPG